jgi:hypothetical protein
MTMPTFMWLMGILLLSFGGIVLPLGQDVSCVSVVLLVFRWMMGSLLLLIGVSFVCGEIGYVSEKARRKPAKMRLEKVREPTVCVRIERRKAVRQEFVEKFREIIAARRERRQVALKHQRKSFKPRVRKLTKDLVLQGREQRKAERKDRRKTAKRLVLEVRAERLAQRLMQRDCGTPIPSLEEFVEKFRELSESAHRERRQVAIKERRKSFKHYVRKLVEEIVLQRREQRNVERKDRRKAAKRLVREARAERLAERLMQRDCGPPIRCYHRAHVQQRVLRKVRVLRKDPPRKVSDEPGFYPPWKQADRGGYLELPDLNLCVGSKCGRRCTLLRFKIRDSKRKKKRHLKNRYRKRMNRLRKDGLGEGVKSGTGSFWRRGSLSLQRGTMWQIVKLTRDERLVVKLEKRIVREKTRNAELALLRKEEKFWQVLSDLEHALIPRKVGNAELALWRKEEKFWQALADLEHGLMPRKVVKSERAQWVDCRDPIIALGGGGSGLVREMSKDERLSEQQRKLGKLEKGERTLAVGKRYSSDYTGDGPPRRPRVPRSSVVPAPIVSDVEVGNQMVVDLLVDYEVLKVDCKGGVPEDIIRLMAARVDDVYERSKQVVFSHRAGTLAIGDDFRDELGTLEGRLCTLYERITGVEIDGFEPIYEGALTWEEMKNIGYPKKDWMEMKKKAEELEVALLKKLEGNRLKAAKKKVVNTDEVSYNLRVCTFKEFCML